jgi:hypothetical protein
MQHLYRMLAWPIILIGAAIVAAGGGFILLGAWMADVDVQDE